MPEASSLMVKGLTKTYQLGGKVITAVKNVSFSLERGECLAVTGYSGSGKSTLLGLIGGLDRPTSGDVVLDGVAYSALSERRLSALRRKTIGFVFQTFNLFPSLTAYENIQLAGRIAGLSSAEASKRANSLLEKVGLEGRARHRPPQLSGGEQQRVAVARALVFQPRLLLADEPTGDLDSQNGDVVADLMFSLCRDYHSTCILATHNLDLARLADRRLALRDGVCEDDEVPAGEPSRRPREA